MNRFSAPAFLRLGAFVSLCGLLLCTAATPAANPPATAGVGSATLTPQPPVIAGKSWLLLDVASNQVITAGNPDARARQPAPRKDIVIMIREAKHGGKLGGPV